MYRFRVGQIEDTHEPNYVMNFVETMSIRVVLSCCQRERTMFIVNEENNVGLSSIFIASRNDLS